MVDNPGKSQLIPAMMVIVLLDLTNKVHVHVHACRQAAVVHGAVLWSGTPGLRSQQVGYKVNAYDLALFLFSIRLMVLVRC